MSKSGFACNFAVILTGNKTYELRFGSISIKDHMGLCLFFLISRKGRTIISTFLYAMKAVSFHILYVIYKDS